MIYLLLIQNGIHDKDDEDEIEEIQCTLTRRALNIWDGDKCYVIVSIFVIIIKGFDVTFVKIEFLLTFF